MKYLTRILVIGSAFLLIKCGSVPKAPGDAELTVAQKKWTDAKMEDLTNGHTIYTTKCNSCHGLKKIGDYNEESWNKLIDVMAPKAKLSEDETNKLRKYIYAANTISRSEK